MEFRNAELGEEKKNAYVVIASDLNKYYLVHIPFVIQYWKNLGIDTVLMITLKKNETIKASPAAARVIEMCTELDVSKLLLSISTINTFRLK